MSKILFSNILNEALRDYDEIDNIVKSELTKYVIENKKYFSGISLSYFFNLYDIDEDFVYVYCLDKTDFFTRCINYIKKCLGSYIYALGGRVSLNDAENINYLYSITDIDEFRSVIKKIIDSELVKELHRQFDKDYYGDNVKLSYGNYNCSINDGDTSITFYSGTGEDNYVCVNSRVNTTLEDAFYSALNAKFDSELYSEYYLERLIKNKDKDYRFFVENTDIKPEKTLICSFHKVEENSKFLTLKPDKRSIKF